MRKIADNVRVNFIYVSMLYVVLLILLSQQGVSAQLAEKLYTSDYHIDSLSKGKLSVEVDNLSFYKNNEFVSTIQKGYTQPGFWLQLKAVYYPLSNLKMEAGAHSVWFWGTTLYPAFAYKDLVKWSGRDYSNNVHVLPYFRANLALSDNVSIILGDLYGGSNHRLIEPLYNPELNLTSDPEAGVQLLYKTKWIDFDMWLDWMTYIYNLDTHQEAFVAGHSARFKLNLPDSRFHIYFPLQSILQHKGGEIDVTNSNVQTAINYAAGTGLVWNINGNVLKNINAEFDVAGYHFPKGCTYKLKKGRGYYSKAAVQLRDFNISTSYWACDDFVSMFGSAFYGSVSTKVFNDPATKKENMLYYKPKMLHFGADYACSLGKGFAFGVNMEAYYFLSGRMYYSETGAYEGIYAPSSFGSNTNFSMGVYLRINPSFLLKHY